MTDIIASLYVFMLAAFVGFEVIRRVSPLLHTPLMSLTNALDAIAVVGAIILAGEHKSTLATVLGTIAIVAVHQQPGGRLHHHRPHAQNVQGEQTEEAMTTRCSPDHVIQFAYLVVDGAVHPVAEMDEFAGHRAPRRMGRRSWACCWRSAPRCCTSRHRGLHLDRDCAGAGFDHRRAAGPRTDDRGAATDRAQPCVRSALRHAGRHGGILSARAARAAFHDGGAVDGSDSGQPDFHRQPDGRRQIAGVPAAAPHHL